MYRSHEFIDNEEMNLTGDPIQSNVKIILQKNIMYVILSVRGYITDKIIRFHSCTFMSLLQLHGLLYTIIIWQYCMHVQWVPCQKSSNSNFFWTQNSCSKFWNLFWMGVPTPIPNSWKFSNLEHEFWVQKNWNLVPNWFLAPND